MRLESLRRPQAALLPSEDLGRIYKDRHTLPDLRSFWSIGTAAADAVTGAWSFTIGQLPDGSTHSYTVTATDAAGNVSQPSAALSFVVDTVTPTVAVSIGNTDVNVTNGTATVTFTFSEAPASFALSDTSAVGGTLSTARPTPRPSRAPPTPTSALPR